jgi:cation diffusion facilitator CzcD-associated flavoprotein CzcO
VARRAVLDRPVKKRGTVGAMAALADVAARAKALATNRPVPLPPDVETPRVAIIGTGIGGLGMAIRLVQMAVDDVTLFEKADALGGTWRDNTYPGSGCDVPSHLYSLSFAPNPHWTRRFPEQAEILEHLERVADEFDVRRRIRFSTEVTAATFDEAAGTWTLAFADGGTFTADVLVAATGQLNRPHVPAIEGLDTFAGTTFHSARWDHDHDLTGEDVAVIGIGASAIQFVPAIAERVGRMTLFQRSVNYVGPKPDAPIGERARQVYNRFPLARLAYRASIWARFESRFVIFKQGSKLGEIGRKKFADGLRPLVTDDLPEEAVVPDYPLGCRRILISNDWYPTLARPDVEVVTAGVDRIEPDAVVAGGQRYPADTIIFGTGFETTDFLAPITVTGAGGTVLGDVWADGAEAHLGITVSGFPNLFLLYGPNTNLGHNSIIFMLERQIGWILQAVRTLATEGRRWVDVRPEAQAASNARLDRELARTVWAGACHSWYKDARGRITNNWSSYTWRYWQRTRRLRPSDLRLGPARSTRAPAPEPEREPAGV